MRTVIFAAGLLALSCVPGVFAEDYDARLTALDGTVDVQAGGENDSWREAEEGMPLSAGDKVRTGEDASAEITLDDGAVIHLNPGSSMEIASLDPGRSSFSLGLGGLVAKIKAGFIKRGKKLQVRTPAAICAIRGTEFGVEHDEAGGETTAGVFDEGSLSVASVDNDGKTLAEEQVGKGNEVRLRAGARAFKPGALRRLLRHRKTLETTRGRLGLLRRNWKRLDPKKRLEMRKRFMARKIFRGVRAAKRGADGVRQKLNVLENFKKRAGKTKRN